MKKRQTEADQSMMPGQAPGFLCLEFTCSQDSLREGLDADKPVVQRYGKTPASRAS
jgi:hypothetical protein